MTAATMQTAFAHASSFGADFAQARAGWAGAVNNVSNTVSVAVRLAVAAVPFAAVCAIFSAV